MKKYLKISPFTFSLVVIIVGVFSYLIGIPFLDLIELKTIDLRFKSRGTIPIDKSSNNIVLAVIDEESIDKEGKWIWPRSKLADLILKLSDAGAKVIAFDIGFLEPDDTNQKIIENIKNKFQELGIKDAVFNDYLEILKKETDNDKLLADAIKNSSAKVILGYFFHTDEEMPIHADKEEIRLHESNIRGSAYKAVRYPSSGFPRERLFRAILPQSNIKNISDATDYSGFFNMFPDEDGVVRWIPAIIKFEDMLYAPLGLTIVSAFLNKDISIQIADYGVSSLKIGSLSVPVDEFGRIQINYRGEEKTFPHISVTEILHSKTPDNKLKDKIVIVGATATGIYDMRVTPFDKVFPGVEIHANIADTIISKRFLHQPAWSTFFDICAILFAGILLGIILPRTGAITGAITLISMFIGYVALCQYLFTEKGLILNLVYPLSVMLLIHFFISAYKYLTESSQKRFIKNAFSTYLAPSVVKQLIEEPDRLGLGGEERVITAFFSDVQGFTSISEKLSPKELVELLNEFLTEMTDIILKYEGTVDKFEGDAIIAFFGAPNELKNQAEAACKACIDMQKRLVELREVWKAQGKPELRMRIGLCTGPAVVGNMGSKNRMDYTMMGDTVNTAARLEGVNKIYGIYTLISETTNSSAFNQIRTREIDSINVVGKKEPVRVYQIIGYPNTVDKQTNQMIDHYITGLYAYRAQEWNKAIHFFNAVLEIDPDDGPAKTMLARCEEFQSNPPPPNWNGAFTMKTK